MRAKTHTKALTRSDANATIAFLETALQSRRRAGRRASVDASVCIDDIARLLRRVRHFWDELGMPDPAQRELAEVLVGASWTSLDLAGRYVETKRKWSAAIGFEVQLPQ
jgi:hypothetical protein